MTHMEKTILYLRKDELDALSETAVRTGRSVDEVIHDAIRRIILEPSSIGPAAIWDGQPNRSSLEHDSIHDEH
jgi:hypothetical protein